MNEPIDIPTGEMTVPEIENRGLTEVHRTSAQAKVDAVANLTMAAYSKASTLKLSPEEVKELEKEFPDEAFKPGAAGKENLIYIEHAFLRDRLNSVFGPGQWSIIPRNRWGEDFTIPARPPKQAVHGVKIYVEAMLLVRGCFVSESVGSMDYYPSNGSQDYSDAVEGAKTAALRRCCKELGIGLQAWKKDWCEGWWKRKKALIGNPNTRSESPRNAPVPKISTSPEVPQTKPKASEGNREWLMKEIGENTQYATEYCRKSGMLLPTENLEQLPDRFIPLNQEQMDLWFGCLDAFVEGSEAKKPFVNDIPEPRKRPAYVQPEQKELPTGPGSWRNTVIHYGKNAGKTLGKLSQNSLAWYVNNFKITPTYESGGKTYNKKPETMEKDKLFRKSLDQAQFELGIPDEIPM